jgi:ABC-type dipeptide/oligopeptide/nickel transport system permease component
LSKRQRFILRRAGSALVIAFIAVSFSFVLFRALPGDATANLSRVPNFTEEARAALRARPFGRSSASTGRSPRSTRSI